VIHPVRPRPPPRRREQQQLSTTGAAPPTVQPRLPDQTTPVQDRFQFCTRLPSRELFPTTVTLEDEEAISEPPAEIFLKDREHAGVYHRRRFRHVGYEEPLDKQTESESDSEESEEPDEDEIAQ
jgi:hypothetical protein